MFAALPLIFSLAPEIARWIGGSQAATVTTAVAAAVRQVAGTDDPEAAAAVLGADPAKAAELRVKLAQIAADAETAQRQADLESFKAELAAGIARRQADLDELKAQIADSAGARGTMTELAKMNSILAWGSPALSAIILLSFATMVWFVVTRDVSEGNMPLANVLLGTLAAMATQVANYWLGSSSGSRNKDGLLQDAQNKLASSIPAGAIPTPGAIISTGKPPAPEADDLNAAELSRIRARA